MTVGLLAMNPGLDFPAAEKEFRQVLQSSPNNAAAKNGLTLSLLAQGRFTEAEEACRQALLLDPLLTNLWFNLGRITVGTGRYKEAGEAFRKGLELQPNASRFHTYLATLDILQNRPARPRRMHNWRQKVSGATTRSHWCNKRKPIDRQPTLRSRILSPRIRSAVHFRSPCSTQFERNPRKCSSGSILLMPPAIPV